MSVTAKIKRTLEILNEKTAVPAGTTSREQINTTKLDADLSNGTGSGKVNGLFNTSITIPPGTAKLVSMKNGAIDGGAAGTDNLGQAFSFGAIRYLRIENPSTTETLLVGFNATTQGWSSPFYMASDPTLIQVQPTGVLELVAPKGGYQVGSSSNYNLKIDNQSATTIACGLVVLGSTT